MCIDEHAFLRDIERLIRRQIPREVVPGFEPDPHAVPQKVFASRGGRGQQQPGSRSAPSPRHGHGHGTSDARRAPHDARRPASPSARPASGASRGVPTGQPARGHGAHAPHAPRTARPQGAGRPAGPRHGNGVAQGSRARFDDR